MSFIKWMGGKSKVLHLFKDYFPDFSKINGYIEPLLGGGSVFFYLKENCYLDRKPVYLSDINNELIITYKVVRDKLDELIPLLEKHRRLNCKDHFADTKKRFPTGDDIKIAGDFVYLVNNAMGGVWRVNQQGKFNNAYGCGPNGYSISKDELFKCSKYLQYTDIECQSFEKILELDIEFDGYFIYLDPPYMNVSNNSWNTESRYTKEKLNIDLKIMIPKVFKRLDELGCKVMLSNSDSPIIYKYFKDYYINKIQTERRRIGFTDIRNRNIIKNNDIQKWTEIIVTNYEIKKKQKTILDAWS